MRDLFWWYVGYNQTSSSISSKSLVALAQGGFAGSISSSISSGSVLSRVIKSLSSQVIVIKAIVPRHLVYIQVIIIKASSSNYPPYPHMGCNASSNNPINTSSYGSASCSSQPSKSPSIPSKSNEASSSLGVFPPIQQRIACGFSKSEHILKKESFPLPVIESNSGITG